MGMVGVRAKNEHRMNIENRKRFKPKMIKLAGWIVHYNNKMRNIVEPYLRDPAS